MLHTRRQFMHHVGCASALGALSPLAAWAQTIDQVKIFYGFPSGSAGGRIVLESLKGAPADGSVLKLSPFSCTSIYPPIYTRSIRRT